MDILSSNSVMDIVGLSQVKWAVADRCLGLGLAEELRFSPRLGLGRQNNSLAWLGLS